jgi:membrane-associated protease RseP (regulator of RpoE activity)
MAFFLMAMIVFILIVDILLLPLMIESEGLGVQYALAIPGLNPMLPLVYGIIGLIVALVVHEMAHGIQTRANDMKVDSMGLLHAVVPIGAFCEPNNEEINNCSRKARSSMYAAGIAVNLTLALVLFLVMSMGLMGTMSSKVGDNAAVINVTADSPAYYSGIGYSSVILEVGEVPSGEIVMGPAMMTYDNLMEYSFIPGVEYYVFYATKDGPASLVKMYMGIFIDAVVPGSPAALAGIPAKSFLVSIGGFSVGNIQEFSDAMTSFSPGETVLAEYALYSDPETTLPPVSVELGDRNGRAFLGVNYSLSGFSFTTPNTVLAAVKNPLKDAESITDGAMAALSYIGMPLRGYSPIPQEIQWWYESSVMNDQTFWIVLQTVFWIFWLNLVLAVTNALPAVPFDGGYLLRDGVGSIIDRTHRQATEEKREQIVNSITRVVSYIMLFILMMVMIAILF